jgi:hypothetical protein
LHTLSVGTYLSGDAFNGLTSTTWAVEATSINTPGKVVARDASGDFAAQCISADTIRVLSTTAASSMDTGALIVTGGVGVSGDVHADSLYADSDRRLKRDISVIDDTESLQIVSQLSPCRYSYTRDESARRRVGLIAQELKELVPEAVKESLETGFLSVDMQQLVPLVAGSVCAVHKRIEEVRTDLLLQLSDHQQTITELQTSLRALSDRLGV